MPIGPGRYDKLCTLVRERAKATGAVVIVFGGERGDGFSMQAPMDITLDIATVLETMARQIREGFQQGRV